MLNQDAFDILNVTMKVRCVYDKLVPISELKSHPKNRNIHPDDQIARLAQILDYQGFRYPVKVSKLSGFVTSGHGRIEAAKKNGWTEVPVNFQEYESEEQEYADLVADNAIALWAELDLSGINIDLGDLGPDFELDLLGIENFEIDVSDKYADQDPDAVPEVPKEAVTKPGDLYQLGNHRLLCGDSTNIQHVERLMNGQKAEMLFTDPPYGVNYEGGHFHSGDVNIKRKREKLANDLTSDIYKDVMPVVALTVDGPCYTWFAFTQCRPTVEAIEAIGEMHALIIWHKTNAKYAAMNAQYKQRHEPCIYWKPKGSTLRWIGPTNECTIWEIKRDGRNEFHPTQKPVELAERAIRNHSSKTVLDLFGGSGSTLIACEKTNRKCFMMELDPLYCDVIVKRWENFTGQKAKLIDGTS